MGANITNENDLKTLTPQPKVYTKPPYTVEVPGVPIVAGETVPRRNVKTKDTLQARPEPEVKTVFDIVRRASKKYGNVRALGKRQLIKRHEEVTEGGGTESNKRATLLELSGYEYMSFAEYEDLVLKIGSAFRALGLKPSDRIHLYAATHPYWLATAHGAGSQSMPIVTAYSTLGRDGLEHSLVQTGAKAIFLDPALLPNMLKPLRVAKEIQYIIYNDDLAPTTSPEMTLVERDIRDLKERYPEITIHPFSEFIKLGEDNMVDPTPPQPEDLCCIMYTSGSVGEPKGVLLKHKNVVAAVAGGYAVLGPYLGPGDRLLAYLPLAHILEYVFESACLFWGGTLGYSNPKTLTDSVMHNCQGDLREFRPTVLVGVPAVWESVRKGILAKVAELNFISRNMFWSGLAAKNLMMDNSRLPGSDTLVGVLDSAVFHKIAEATGGRLRFCMNGGGPIAKETQRFISMCVAPLVTGYGLTETAGMGAMMDPRAWTDNALGELTGSIEVKLVDFPDAGYYAANTQGEIWIRGDAVASGYLNLKEETEEAFTTDGWFKTGDIGEFDLSGNLRLIDRKKNLIKNLNGEYLALEKLESIYRSTMLVSNICIYAASDQKRPIALVVPTEMALKSLASSRGRTVQDVKNPTMRDLCASEEISSTVLKEMQAHGLKGGLRGVEIIQNVVLVNEEWTPQNGLLTAAQKLNRKSILQRYEGEIAQAYVV